MSFVVGSVTFILQLRVGSEGMWGPMLLDLAIFREKLVSWMLM